MLRHRGGFRRHCWMLPSRLSLFSSLIVHGRTEAVIPERLGVSRPVPQMQRCGLFCEINQRGLTATSCLCV